MTHKILTTQKTIILENYAMCPSMQNVLCKQTHRQFFLLLFSVFQKAQAHAPFCLQLRQKTKWRILLSNFKTQQNKMAQFWRN